MALTPLLFITGNQEAWQVMNDVVRDHGSDLPPAVYAHLSKWVGPFGDRVVNTAEGLYASLQQPGITDEVKKDRARRCAQMAQFAMQYSWLELGQTDRGPKMLGVCYRVLGMGEQPADQDPEPLPSLV